MRGFWQRLVAAWFVTNCFVATGTARDIYVDNIAGDDRFEGSQLQAAPGNGPVRTIAKALRLAQSGDTIVLADTSEPYRESVSLMGSRHSSSPIAPFRIRGNGATLDGSAPIAPDAWLHHLGDVFCFAPAHLGYQQLFLSGRPALRKPTTPADVTLPDLQPLEWCLSGGKIYFCVESGLLPQDYELACCNLRCGLTLYYVEGVVVEDLFIQGYQVDGINVHDVVRSATFNRLTCRGNGRNGISAGGASRVEIDSCLLGDNGQAQLRCEEFAEVRLYETDLIDNTAPTIIQLGGRVLVDGQTAKSDGP